MPVKTPVAAAFPNSSARRAKGPPELRTPGPLPPILQILIGKLAIRTRRNPNKTNEGGHL